MSESAPRGALVGGLAEVVIWTHDIESSLAFYRDLLGLEVISPPSLPNRFLKAGEAGAGVPAMVVLVPHPQAGHRFPAAKSERVLHHLAFSTGRDQAIRLRAACEAAGLPVRGGVHPVLSGVETFYIDDPDGNEVEIISPA